MFIISLLVLVVILAISAVASHSGKHTGSFSGKRSRSPQKTYYRFDKPPTDSQRTEFKPISERQPESLPQRPKVYVAKVDWIIDGDTLMVSNELFSRRRIRLDSIDCPEDGQPWGDTAKFGLIKIVGRKQVKIEDYGEDCYGRTLATLYVKQKDGSWLNVNERMVMLGHAWVMRMYYRHLPKHRRDKLNQLENWAKRKKVGLWRHPNPVPPWNWRKSDSC